MPYPFPPLWSEKTDVSPVPSGSEALYWTAADAAIVSQSLVSASAAINEISASLTGAGGGLPPEISVSSGTINLSGVVNFATNGALTFVPVPGKRRARIGFTDDNGNASTADLDTEAGSIKLYGQHASGSAQGGSIQLNAGDGDQQTGGYVGLVGGNSNTSKGGDISLQPGTGSLGAGTVSVQYSLTLSPVAVVDVPLPGADQAGKIIYVAGGPGVPDGLRICLKDGADNYNWNIFTVVPD